MISLYKLQGHKGHRGPERFPRFPVLPSKVLPWVFWPRFLHSALVQSRVIQGGEEDVDVGWKQWEPPPR